MLAPRGQHACRDPWRTSPRPPELQHPNTSETPPSNTLNQPAAPLPAPSHRPPAPSGSPSSDATYTPAHGLRHGLNSIPYHYRRHGHRIHRLPLLGLNRKSISAVAAEARYLRLRGEHSNNSGKCYRRSCRRHVRRECHRVWRGGGGGSGERRRRYERVRECVCLHDEQVGAAMRVHGECFFLLLPARCKWSVC